MRARRPAVRLALLSLCVVSACAYPRHEPYRPVVDTANRAQYDADLADCRALAAEYDWPDRSHARDYSLFSIAVGTLIGVAIGADAGGTAAAIAGGAIGAALGAKSAEANIEHGEQHRRGDIVGRCMEGRGHRVLG